MESVTTPNPNVGNFDRILNGDQVVKELMTTKSNIVVIDQSHNIVINNTAIYAGELDLADSAPADDGYLDAVLFSGSFDYLRRYLLAHRYLPKQLRTLSTKAKRSLEHIRGKTFEIHLKSDMLAQIAGEEFSHGKDFQIKTFPEIFTVKVK